MDAYYVNALWHIAAQIEKDAKDDSLWPCPLAQDTDHERVKWARENFRMGAEMTIAALKELEAARPDLATMPPNP